MSLPCHSNCNESTLRNNLYSLRTPIKPSSSPIVEPFPRRKSNEDIFQQNFPSKQSKNKVRVNTNWTTSISSLFLNFYSFLFFGYSAQRLRCETERLGQNAFRWRRRRKDFSFVEGISQQGLLLLLHLLSLIAFGCSAAAVSSNTGLDASSLPSENPLLKHRRESLDFREQQNMCHIWTKHTPRDLCSRSRWSRLRLMRQISLFSRDCDTESDNVQLGEFFRLDWQTVRSESDLVERSEHLRDGTEGRSCVLAEANSDECLRCFGRVGEGLEFVGKAYQAFDRVLHRFDCGLAVDSASATRPFSPNGTCHDCKRWYRKWLLVQLVQVWREPACINWCYYAQLSCPHLATIRVVDFAGHPTFLCRDLDIPQQGLESQRSIDGVASCNCVHPCDLSRLTNRELDEMNTRQQQLPIAFDFFAANEHCAQRQKRCHKEKLRAATLSDGFVDTKLSPATSHRGFVDEQSDELYNRLINDRNSDPSTTISSAQSIDANELPFQQKKRKRRRFQHNSGIQISLHKLFFLTAITLIFRW